jgi:YfiH family protein
VITLDVLDAPGRVRHAFFTREGGVSTGLYASLNCGYGSADDPEAVTGNRRRAAARLGLEAGRLATVHQIHSPACVVVEVPFARGSEPRADAMVTRVRGLALGILTADCAPVLFADAEAGVVGAAHAGWKGAVGGVVEATVEAMVGLGARRERIAAAVGPCIARQSYEVGPEFPAPFLAAEPADADLFSPSQRAGHHMFDLPGYVARRLARAGVTRVATTRHDTAAEAERFFSYRRSVLRGEPDYGRQLSAIVLEG